MVTCNARDKFLLAKLTKKVLRMVNFTNLKTSSGYITKSKPQGVCLQLIQILGVDYVIWPFYVWSVIGSSCVFVLYFFVGFLN